jgi:tRNA/rRNA methyltransferase
MQMTQQDVRTLWGALVRLVEGPRTQIQTRKRTGPRQTPKKQPALEKDNLPE